MERYGKQYVPSYWIRLIHVGPWGQGPGVFLVGKSLPRKVQLVWAKVEPRFDVLRPDPRFKSLLSRMRLSEDAARGQVAKGEKDADELGIKRWLRASKRR